MAPLFRLMKKHITLLALGVLFISNYAFSQEESLQLIAKSKYFSVYSYPGLDVNSLLNTLDFNYLLQPDSLSKHKQKSSLSLLSDTLDTLYLEVSDILDIHIYSFHGNIKIVRTQADVSSIFKKYFNQSFPERSFYLHERNTIYIAFPGLTLGMLGHEISHSIISHYFVVLPPEKMQEILCGYVEYGLRKETGTLP